MQLNQLRYVMKVYECGSIAKAAKALFITQPTLSQQIAQLENELKVKLFVRHKRGVSPTDAGEEFVTYSRIIIQETDNLLKCMDSYAVKAKGKIKIGVLWIFADLGLAELLSDFRAKYPEIEAEITIDGSVRLLEMLKNRALDAIFFINARDSQMADGLFCIKMYESDMMLVLPAEHRLASKAVLHLTDLDGESIVMPDKISTIYDPLAGYLRQYGVEPKVVAQSSQTDVALACAENGIAISFASNTIAQKYKNPKTVVRQFEPLIKRDVYYAALKETQVIPSVRLFTEYVSSLGNPDR